MNRTPLYLPAALIFTLMIAACGKAQEKPVGFKVEKESADAVRKVSDVQPSSVAPQQPAKKFKGFKVYSDANSPDNHYAASGWMGDWGDLKLKLDDFTEPHGGSTCIKIEYSAQRTKGANWAGIYWQNPPNNWGSMKGGYDISGAKKLTFWCRGAAGGEKIEEFRVGGIGGDFPDSDIASIGPVLLTKEWKQYEIDLTDKDLSSINGGFMWSANVDGNPSGFTIFFDDIKYE